MKPADDKILEYLNLNGPNLPSNITKHIDLSRKYIGQRCRVLAENGLLENKGKGLYAITDDGRDYLAGVPDASELSGESSSDEE